MLSVNKIKKAVSGAVKFVTFRIVFNGIYSIHARKPVQNDKVLFVEVREPRISASFQLLYKKLKKDKRYRIHTHCLRSGFVGRLSYLRRCTAMLKDLADAKYVFLNEGCNVIGSIPMRSETILTQTWHACGAFKRFGFSTAELKYGETAEEMRKYPYYGNTTYVTLSSPDIAWAYEEAMLLQGHTGCLLPTGVSRTDVFFQRRFLEAARTHFAQCVPFAAGRKVLLYAPTFRGQAKEAYSPGLLDVQMLKQALGQDYVLVVKHHPFVKSPPKIPQSCADFAKDVTKELSIEELLCVSDVCISDYSSLVFEYSLFEKPMLFFAYDLEGYFDWRGFYYDYYELAPGPVVRTNEELISQIRQLESQFDPQRVREFRQRFMASCDGHATERILKLVLA
ncbi:MAG: CDP-glycerol glycerophosphotransferase family protein [Eubacterium sp.]|nr:CDP-glycerol glycerophosphotransferase family protein [Eubacterium sp.]